ncbi:hypothetical protein AN958_01077 [Leucoagaricus sp. SymC.cos]|nr:hypothetical protein AN958_01077 [Leucoagaricus sp. SymC.cos]
MIKVNRELNHFASIHYLGTGLAGGVILRSAFSMALLLEEISIKSDDEHHWNPLRVLSTWLWLKELKYIYHDIPEDASYTRFVEDVRHLIGIIRRMPNSVLESLHVRNRYPVGDNSEEELHLKLWRDVLEATFEKGCRKLVVQEPESLYAYPFQNQARLWPHPRREIGFIDDDEADDDEHLCLVKQQLPMLHEPSLKSLTKVRAHPHLLAWIFSYPSTITNLRFVHPLDILGRSTNPNEDFWFSDLKRALDTIHSSPTPTPSSSSSDPPFAEPIVSGVELKIHFNFDNKHAANHMMYQVQFFRSSDQRQRPWSKIIKRVLVNIRYPAESPYFNGALPERVWLFPSPDELRLEWDVAPFWGFVNPKFERKMELISRALASRCPKVKVLSG